MEISNIIEIVIALDIALIAIAYPLMIKESNSIGEKYNSENLNQLFFQLFPQKQIAFLKISWLEIIIICVLVSFVPLILKFPPPEAVHKESNEILNFIIINSANIIVIIASFVFVIIFIYYLRIIQKYNSAPKNLTKHLIYNYKNSSNNDLKAIYLYALYDLSIYYILKIGYREHRDLLNFYYESFKKKRENTPEDEFVEYDIEMYEFIVKIAELVSKSDKLQMNPLLHRAITGKWLLGEESNAKSISEKTYRYLWRIISNIVDKPYLIREFWKNSHDYIDYKMKNVIPEYDDSGIKNNKEVEKSEKEREKFKEFHYALGGYLYYEKQYKTIEYILSYSESTPPRRPLLPYDMAEIFRLAAKFRSGVFDFTYDIDYYFKGLDNIGNSYRSSYYIICYLSILFIRQFGRQEYYIDENHTEMPELHNGIDELVSVKRIVPYFESCIKEVLHDTDLLNFIKYESIVKDREEDILKYFDDLEVYINKRIRELKLSEQLNKECIENFKLAVKESFNKKLNQLESNKLIKIEKEEVEIGFEKVSYLNGFISEIPKSIFSGDCGDRYQKDYIEIVNREKVENKLLSILIKNRRTRYLIEKELLQKAFDKLGFEKGKHILIGIDLNYDSSMLLSKLDIDYIKITNRYNIPSNCLLLIKRIEIPQIKFNEILDKDKELYGEDALVDENLNLYCTVKEIDFNKDIFSTYKPEEVEVPINIIIAFNASVYLKKDHNITLLEIVSPYSRIEQGVPNELDDIKPI